ncbi:transmembrane protein 17-like isoform X1 [Mobula birostris]|uniref:transmembrane protein 17-like isoform X1 n=1 Tax=Mobula birostris TaxID=1983395 RepID=UPI003B28B518
MHLGVIHADVEWPGVCGVSGYADRFPPEHTGRDSVQSQELHPDNSLEVAEVTENNMLDPEAGGLYEYLSTYYQITLIALILVMTLVEVVRLYLGYVGNLQEKVPQLAGSWLLTLLLQLPMLLFQLLTPHLWVLPAEWASSLLYLALLLSQALLALLALRRLASQLEARFRLSHLRLGEAWGPSAAPPSWRGRGQF